MKKAEPNAGHFALTELQINNQIAPLPSRYPIELGYKENTLSFSIASLAFSDPSKNKMYHRLVGLDTTWIDAGTRNFIASADSQ